MRTDIDTPGYGEVWAPVYDALYGTQFDAEPLVALLAMLVAGRSILEFGIGTGRVALALAAKGWRVSGIELSREMVKLLRQRPAPSGSTSSSATSRRPASGPHSTSCC